MRRAVDRTVFAPVAGARPYLALKATLLVLGFDLWLTRLPHGGRYGAGGFNVAHWAWLDAIQPPVSPAVYVGLCVGLGAFCFALAFASRPPRSALAVLLVLYTWSWAMSMLDSYQHHYLFSLVILAMVFFPKLTAEDALAPPRERKPGKRKGGSKGKAKRRKKRGRAERAATERELRPPRLLAPFTAVTAWGWVLASWSTAIVYGYTAYAKTDPEWLSGAALKRVLRLPESGAPPPGAEDPIDPFRTLMGAFGLEGETFWWAMGHGVVLVQIVCCAGYLLAPFRDVVRSRVLRAFYWVALLTALSFHAGAEYMDLKIGWFSWYMIGYAFLFFLPGSWITTAGRAAIPLVGTRFGPEVLALRIGAGVIAVVVGAATEWWVLTGLGLALLLVTPLRLVAKAAWAAKADPKVHDAERARTLDALALGAAAAGALSLVGVGYAIDLPGAGPATVVGAVALAAGVVGLLVAKGEAARIHGYGVGTAVAALALLATVLGSDVRWDFYRKMGGFLRRSGDHAAAYVAYVKANRYSPPDDDRQEKVDELREILERRGELPEVE